MYDEVSKRARGVLIEEVQVGPFVQLRLRTRQTDHTANGEQLERLSARFVRNSNVETQSFEMVRLTNWYFRTSGLSPRLSEGTPNVPSQSVDPVAIPTGFPFTVAKLSPHSGMCTVAYMLYRPKRVSS